MSLALLQGYSSEEEGEQERFPGSSLTDEEEEEDEEDDDGKIARNRGRGYKPPFDFPKPTSESALPSAFDAFSEVAGPPDFLNNSVAEYDSKNDIDQRGRRRGDKTRREKKDLPPGAVVEAKPQLVGIRDRVRSDIEGNYPSTSSGASQKGNTSSVASATEGKRVATASNPDAKDASDLLRMCLQCGVPKTYSNARGMVCPICGDRPVTDEKDSEKKKGSTIKDKEKSKRMKGQSSHATWKSETEMQLRQQFD